MAKSENIVSYTSEELKRLRMAHGGGPFGDMAAVDAKTEEELGRDIASDPDWRDVPVDWYKDAALVIPKAEQPRWVPIDDDVLAWFTQQGPGHKTRINDLLRTFVQQQAKRRA